MSDDDDTSIPVEPTTHPLDESAELDVDSYPEAVTQAQDLLEHSSAYTALIEIPEGMAHVSGAKDKELEDKRHFAHIGTMLRGVADEHDITVVEAAKAALKLSDPSRWVESGTRTVPEYLREKTESGDE